MIFTAHRASFAATLPISARSKASGLRDELAEADLNLRLAESRLAEAAAARDLAARRVEQGEREVAQLTVALARSRELLLAGGRDEDAGACLVGEEHRERGGAAADPEDEDRLPGNEPAPGEERSVRRQRGKREGRRLRPAQVRGLRIAVRLGHGDQLGVRPVLRPAEDAKALARSILAVWRKDRKLPPVSSSKRRVRVRWESPATLATWARVGRWSSWDSVCDRARSSASVFARGSFQSRGSLAHSGTRCANAEKKLFAVASAGRRVGPQRAA